MAPLNEAGLNLLSRECRLRRGRQLAGAGCVGIAQVRRRVLPVMLERLSANLLIQFIFILLLMISLRDHRAPEVLAPAVHPLSTAVPTPKLRFPNTDKVDIELLAEGFQLLPVNLDKAPARLLLGVVGELPLRCVWEKRRGRDGGVRRGMPRASEPEWLLWLRAGGARLFR